ncbi:phosphoglycerate kinase [Pararhizobium haloflavum]|uniref:phosphoglycerate kinase n=1 Tax=Pararhizobium haloflavum TaxID=2037914 RepID=UPI000C18EF55|nr:phosphoglycerate kinase [Pararhizobium haloflavum]
MNAFETTSVDLNGKTVLVLADLDFGIGNELIAMLKALTAAQARAVVMSGLGDPRGDINPVLSLGSIAPELKDATGRPVTFVSDCVGAIAEAGVGYVAHGAIALLENLRFHPGETRGERAFANRLALLGDYFVDARSRPVAATAASARVLPWLMPVLTPAEPDEPQFSLEGRS